jgi:hypothetical protein
MRRNRLDEIICVISMPAMSAMSLDFAFLRTLAGQDRTLGVA